MFLDFHKYQGTGNDFVMIDDREERFDIKAIDLVQKLCDRKFGVGADGLILIRNHADYDFEMIYYNADGSQSMCGNGARCAVSFAKQLQIIQEKTHFLAIDGPHTASIDADGWVSLKMGDVSQVSKTDEDYFVNTGSPHHIRLVNDITHYPVYESGKVVRYSDAYKPHGTNVNFIEKINPQEIFVRTYERGVENETLSCGTGVTACALVMGVLGSPSPVKIKTLGGSLQVKFTKKVDGSYHDIYLEGPAQLVFEGEVDTSKILLPKVP